MGLKRPSLVKRALLVRDNCVFNRPLGHSLYLFARTAYFTLPVMAAVAVRKKVVSIGHFSPSLCLQFFFHLLYQIKSYCKNWLHWKLEKSRTEQNKLDKLEYLKSFIKTTSYAHWHAFLYLHVQTRVQISIHLFHLKSEKNWAKWAKWARLI